MSTKPIFKEERDVKTINLLKNTTLTYEEIAKQVGMSIPWVARMGLQHRPKEARRQNTKGRPDTSSGDRKRAAEMLLAGTYSFDEIHAETGVPLGSLTKVREYTLFEQKHGLPITGKSVPREIKEQLKQSKPASVSTPQRLVTKKVSLQHTVDHEFEADSVPVDVFYQQLDAIKNLVESSQLPTISYTIGVNLKGE